MKFNILNLSVVNPKLPLSNNMTNKCVILSERNMMIPTNALKDTNATNEGSDISSDRFRWSDPQIPITHKIMAAITLGMMPIVLGAGLLLTPFILLKMWICGQSPNDPSSPTPPQDVPIVTETRWRRSVQRPC